VTLNIGVSLASATAPQGLVGQAYAGFNLRDHLTITGDASFNSSSPVTWSVASGTLPAGLTLNTSTGVVSGTPTAAASSTVTFRATYRGVNGQQNYSLVTLNIGVSLASATAPQGIVGQTYAGFNLRDHLTITGDASFNSSSPVSWSVASGTLPAGLMLNASTGVITGTPTAAASSTVTFRATYRGVNGQQNYSLVTLNIGVSLATATAPQGIVGQAYAGFNLRDHLTVTGDASFNSSSPVTWAVASGTLPAGLTLNTSTGVVSGTPTAAASSTVTFRATYRGVSGQQNYSLVTLSIGVSLATATAPQGIVGQAYAGFNLRDRLTVTGDASFNSSSPVSWSIVSGALPVGLALNESTGVIAGTPTLKTSGASFEVRASYKGKDGEQVYTIIVNGVPLQVTQISASTFHTCAITTAGAAMCWGSGATGRLGDGGLTSSSIPVSVTGLGSGVTQIAAGSEHTCAVHNGAAKCWGSGTVGQLGHGETTQSLTPVNVTGLESGVTQMAASTVMVCAVHNGAAKCWGSNSNGQLGDGSTIGSATPVNVTGLGSGITQIAAGGGHACAVHSGTAKCWGAGSGGRLGHGSTASSTVPVEVQHP